MANSCPTHFLAALQAFVPVGDALPTAVAGAGCILLPDSALVNSRAIEQASFLLKYLQMCLLGPAAWLAATVVCWLRAAFCTTADCFLCISCSTSSFAAREVEADIYLFLKQCINFLEAPCSSWAGANLMRRFC